MSIVAIFVNVLLFLPAGPALRGRPAEAHGPGPVPAGPAAHPAVLRPAEAAGQGEPQLGRDLGRSACPAVAFASILAVIALVPFGLEANVLAGRVDVITIIYLLTLGGVAVLLGALASRNTFALIGASREMVTMIMVEPVLAMTLILGAVQVKQPGAGRGRLQRRPARATASRPASCWSSTCWPSRPSSAAAVRHRRSRGRDSGRAVHRVQRARLRPVQVLHDAEADVLRLAVRLRLPAVPADGVLRRRPPHPAGRRCSSSLS